MNQRKELRFESLERRAMLASHVTISEFHAKNESGIEDDFSERTDWIEILNSGESDENLVDWYLTDDIDQLAKWRFPSISLSAGQRIVVFASGRDIRVANAPLHTNFKLSSNGEYLALVRPDNSVAHEYSPAFPPQYEDVSYGISEVGDDAGDMKYFDHPTPGSDNTSSSFSGVVEDLVVSTERGFFSTAETIEISTETKGATIAYTLDGSLPSLSNGEQVLPQPDGDNSSLTLTIDATTILRIAAFKTDFISSPTVTHTYIFVDDVITQSPDGEAPEGWPDRPVNGQEFDYGMDPEIVDHPDYAAQIKDALLDLPSFSLVTDRDHLFDPETGFFVNGEEARNNAREWERPASVELIHPDGEQGFQLEAGVRMRGGYSRRDNNPKHAFRLFFRSEYGSAKLDHPLFDEEGVQRFDNLDLRTAQVPSWSLCSPVPIATSGGCRFNTMVRDVFSRDTQGDMGQPYTRSRFYHLYLNGQYWGVFQTQERAEASFAASYFGGEKENYDVLKVEAFPHRTVATDGNLDAWRALWDLAKDGFADDASFFQAQGLDANGNRDPDLHVLLDTENLIDYMLNILYTGNLDSPISNFIGNGSTNNWFGIRDRTGDEGFKFFIHDAEWTLIDLDINRVGPWRAGDRFSQSNPQWIHQQLMENETYRIQFADRAHQLLFNGGALTPEASLARIQERIDQIDLAIIAESARWGDTNRSRPYTKVDWQTEIDRIIEDILPHRTQILVEQLRVAGLRNGAVAPLYPQTNAPTFNQFGGRVDPDSFQLTMTSDGDVFYTLDGSDPRDQQATVATQTVLELGEEASIFVPTDDSLGFEWTLPPFDDEAWSRGATGIGYETNGTDLAELINTDLESTMFRNLSSAYVRIPFSVERPQDFDLVHLRMKYNDGFVAYLNGVEVARANFPDDVTWNSRASATNLRSNALTFETFDISPFKSLLQPGENLLAIHGANRRVSSFDFLIAPELELGTVLDSGTADNAIRYTGPIPINSNTRVMARSLVGSTWSALTDARFIADSSPIRISEIMYHPEALSQNEIEAGFQNENDFEFVELVNLSDTEPVSLAGFRFDQGIEIELTDTVLAPGQRAVVVKNGDAFRFRYGNDPLIVGQFGNQVIDFNLNNQGETIRLVDPLGIPVQHVSYVDDWYPETDGDGYSLEYIAASFDDSDEWSVANSWRPSQLPGGTPAAERLFAGDANGDGVFNSSDLVLVFSEGEYEDQIVGNSTWSTGDWNGDNEFTSGDLVAAFVAGRYISD